MTFGLLRIIILPFLIPEYFHLTQGSNLKPNPLDSHSDSNNVGASLELQCPSCDKIHCTPERPRKLKCKGGITRGVCNCCPVCAKVEGQSCGGIWNYLGRCDRGLVCEPRLDQINVKPQLAEGSCQLSKDAENSHPEHCSPKCSPELCQHKNNLICSALGNAVKTRSCQEDCQHTSCNLCRFKREPPNCKCGFNDFSCMQEYAKCMLARQCFKKDKRCKGMETWLSKNRNFTLKWKFECIVPECQGNKRNDST